MTAREAWKALAAYAEARGFPPPGYKLDAESAEWARVDHALTEILAERAELIALLREVEWGQNVDDGDWGERACPLCHSLEDGGHAPDCRLAAALSASGTVTRRS
jgi:hypothetical protein